MVLFPQFICQEFLKAFPGCFIRRVLITLSTKNGKCVLGPTVSDHFIQTKPASVGAVAKQAGKSTGSKFIKLTRLDAYEHPVAEMVSTPLRHQTAL